MDGNFWGGRKNIRGYTWTRCVRRSLFENANMLLFLLENCQERVKNPNDFNFSIQSSLSLFLSQSAKNIPFFGVGKRVAAINRHRSWREFASNLVPSLSLSFSVCQEYSVLWCSCHKSPSFLERICEQSCSLSLSLSCNFSYEKIGEEK